MSADISAKNTIEFPNRPVLVSETPVFDLAATRQKHIDAGTQHSSGGSCNDGVCVLAWRPRKPAGDVA